MFSRIFQMQSYPLTFFSAVTLWKTVLAWEAYKCKRILKRPYKILHLGEDVAVGFGLKSGSPIL